MIDPTANVEAVFRLNEYAKKALDRLSIETVHDLLHHFPSRYSLPGHIQAIGSLTLGETVTLYGKITKLQSRKAWKRRIPIGEGYLEDGSGRIKLMWFHQPYIAKMYPEGSEVKISGKVTGSPGKLYIANPAIERAPTIFAPEEAGGNDALQPVYPESLGVTSLWFTHAIKKLLSAKVHEQMEDPLPPEIRERYHLPDLATSLLFIHQPKKERDADAARKRFAFEEIFYIQLAKQKERQILQSASGPATPPSKEALKKFLSILPFPLTKAQQKAVSAILEDMEGTHPMSRLLEGDVGSGKTAVAGAAAYALIGSKTGLDRPQVAYMAPTEILAKQHFKSFVEYLAPFNVQIALATGTTAYKFPSKVHPKEPTKISRAQLLKWLANGEIPLLIGTHALIAEKVKFKNLALVIIDEQHRFGTRQRMALAKKHGAMPHLLSMTATPIPRTLALTIYGDLDLTLLDEMPPGRKAPITKIIQKDGRAAAYEEIRRELKTGRQAYVICPRIDEPDPEKQMALLAKSVKKEAERLQKEVFPEYKIAVLHGKMKPKEKDDTMAVFSKGDTHILVATSVVEVGVNVPNASVILIEGAERFGLSQLHQLRGRVLRSTHQPYCFVFAETRGDMTMKRLNAIKNAKNGFELAEMDLEIRGPGELAGGSQWGVSDIGMDALKNLKLVEAARTEAGALIKKDPELKKYPLLRDALAHKVQILHFE